jgi:hypothetical protein
MFDGAAGAAASCAVAVESNIVVTGRRTQLAIRTAHGSRNRIIDDHPWVNCNRTMAEERAR